MSSLKATQIRPGMVIQHENELYTVFSTDHRTPGNKRGSMQTRLKSLRTGTMIDYRFRAEEFVERAILDEIEFEFLYSEGDSFHFMNTKTYEQMEMSREELGETTYYLVPNTIVRQRLVDAFDPKDASYVFRIFPFFFGPHEYERDRLSLHIMKQGEPAAGIRNAAVSAASRSPVRAFRLITM